MRDLGILIWVALLIVGVVGSMVRQIRGRTSQQARRVPAQTRPAQPAQPAHWAQRITAPVVPPPAQPRPPRPPPRPAPAPAERLSPQQASARAEPPRRKPLFAGKSEIVRAVIAAEVLGKPRALNDEYFGR